MNIGLPVDFYVLVSRHAGRRGAYIDLVQGHFRQLYKCSTLGVKVAVVEDDMNEKVMTYSHYA